MPRSLALEGAAMLRALVDDLASIGEHEIVTTAAPGAHIGVRDGVKVVTLPSLSRDFDRLVSSVDGVWLVAPEMDRCLERLAKRVERCGKALFGPGSEAIRRASDKAALARSLRSAGVSYPATISLARHGDGTTAARRLGYPVVVKPRRGAGCCGVSLARNDRELRRSAALARAVNENEAILLQRYVPGVTASVSLLAGGGRAVALAVNRQRISHAKQFAYRGGITPFDHPLSDLARETAVRAVESLPGLRGYVGVDLVLTETDAVVIEINPRLTTAYLGVRAVTKQNVAALAIAACDGTLPRTLSLRGRARFTPAGRIEAVSASSVRR